MKNYLSSAQVRRRYGGRSDTTIWRWEKNPALGFPQAETINGRKLWDAAELDAWDESRRRAQGLVATTGPDD